MKSKMLPTLRAHLIRLAETMAENTGLSLSTLGERAVGNWRFFDHIRKNSFFVDKYDMAVDWFDKNWPDDAKWPTDVVRPSALPK